MIPKKNSPAKLKNLEYKVKKKTDFGMSQRPAKSPCRYNHCKKCILHLKYIYEYRSIKTKFS